MIVIDASALTKYTLHEENWEKIGIFIRGEKAFILYRSYRKGSW